MSKKPENKDEFNIQELLKNSGVESMWYCLIFWRNSFLEKSLK